MFHLNCFQSIILSEMLKKLNCFHIEYSQCNQESMSHSITIPTNHYAMYEHKYELNDPFSKVAIDMNCVSFSHLI